MQLAAVDERGGGVDVLGARLHLLHAKGHRQNSGAKKNFQRVDTEPA